MVKIYKIFLFMPHGTDGKQHLKNFIRCGWSFKTMTDQLKIIWNKPLKVGWRQAGLQNLDNVSKLSFIIWFDIENLVFELISLDYAENLWHWLWSGKIMHTEHIYAALLKTKLRQIQGYDTLLWSNERPFHVYTKFPALRFG